MSFNEKVPSGVSVFTTIELWKGVWSSGFKAARGLAKVFWKPEEAFVQPSLEIENELTQLERLPINLSSAGKIETVDR
ncbi:hypothetical protein N7463_001503 [Penicillium fimorum]|uniref:Uncharacterized protein n=1 Tax=Penicillium fimorum TaxID=1882269 RepID=A0A9X0CC43_9EURO|nr:hypothetical protein N7463_001503 [Penicillium fimorum]